MRVVLIAALACAAGLALAACGEDAGGGDSSVSLPGTVWLLDVGALGGAGSEDVTSDLRFGEGGRAGGSDGCNTFTGSYEVDGSGLRFGPLASTRKACAGAAQQVADRVASALGATRSFSAAADTLVLKDEGGTPLLRYRASAAGVAGAWTVVSVLYDDAIRGVLEGTTLTADFGEQGEVRGSGGCNTFSGPYEEDGPKLRIGPLAATEKACVTPDGANAQERGYFEALASVVRSERAGAKLTLFDAQGRMAVTLDATS